MLREARKEIEEMKKQLKGATAAPIHEIIEDKKEENIE